MIKYDTPYTLLQERFEHPVGTIVYRSGGCDYGCSGDDSRMTGTQHVSMTTNEDGSYPFFTVPEYALKEVL